MILLGSTGSIGVNTVKIAQKNNLKIEGLCANTNVKLLNEQIHSLKPKFVVIGESRLKDKVEHSRVYCGEQGILDMLEESSSDLVVNALVGFAGLKPTIKSIKLKKKVALANKESLVAAGAFIDISFIRPIDSEHFGLWYLLNNRPVKRMVITASGGSFRDTELNKLSSMSVTDALKHPNWSMGNKITIDSATMTNKLFELLEAKWLFDCKSYDALIEKKSIIHALVEFEDGSTTAHFAQPDMKLPISFAILEQLQEPVLPHIKLDKIGAIEFLPIESSRYPIWEIKDALLQNPKLGVVINAANEIAVDKFLRKKINIIELATITKKAFKTFENITLNSLEEVFEIDNEVRKFCKKG